MDFRVNKTTNGNIFQTESRDVLIKRGIISEEENISNKKNTESFRHADTDIGYQNGKINDYDINILESYAYKDIDDDILRTEFDISHLEKKLASINKEINDIEGLNSNVHLGDLRYKRDLLKAKLDRLKNEYKKHSISTDLSSNLLEIFQGITSFSIKDMLVSSAKSVLSFFSKGYREKQEISKSISFLCDINKKVDELVNSKAPYGEAETKYKNLTSFLNKANQLQAKINLKNGKHC